MRYWSIRYVCCPRFFRMNLRYLLQIPVIIHQSLRDPLQITFFLLQIILMGMYLWVPSSPSVVGGGRVGGCCTCEARCTKLVGGVDSDEWGCAGVCKNILVQEIYSAKPNADPKSQYRSQVHNGLGTQAPQSIQYYDLASVILIWPLTQPLTCEMGSSVFVAVSRLKVSSTTWSSLFRIPSTERTNGGKFFCWSWRCRPCLSFFIFPT